jgi:hypothetical protein
MTTAKQRAWREKFARIYGGGKRRTKRARVKTMAKRKTHSRRGQGLLGLGSGFLMKGLLGSKIPGGMLGRFAAGAVYNEVDDRFIPDMIPMIPQDLVGAGILFGLPGLGGALLGNTLTGRGLTHSGMG